MRSAKAVPDLHTHTMAELEHWKSPNTGKVIVNLLRAVRAIVEEDDMKALKFIRLAQDEMEKSCAGIPRHPNSRIIIVPGGAKVEVPA